MNAWDDKQKSAKRPVDLDPSDIAAMEALDSRSRETHGPRILVGQLCRACDEPRALANIDTGEWVCRACGASGGRLGEEFDSDIVRARRAIVELELRYELQIERTRGLLSVVAVLLALTVALGVAVVRTIR